MDKIGNSLNTNDLLFNQMQSNSALGKLQKDGDHKQAEGVGNTLDSFGDILKGQIQNINNLQAQADEAVQTYAVGGDIELHNVVLAVDKADMALQLAMQVRNKVIAAYQEISHMQI